jgi:hypothetical protein
MFIRLHGVCRENLESKRAGLVELCWQNIRGPLSGTCMGASRIDKQILKRILSQRSGV